MPLSIGYERYFIMLDEVQKGYGTYGSKQPTGYVNVERKGSKVKVKGLIQNIKVGTNTDYRLFLIAPDNHDCIEIGRFRMVNEKGEVFGEVDLAKNKGAYRYASALVITGENIVLYGGKKQEKPDILEWFHKKYIRKEEDIASVQTDEAEADRLVTEEIPVKAEEAQERTIVEETSEEIGEEVVERTEPELEEIIDIREEDIASVQTDEAEADRLVAEEIPVEVEEAQERTIVEETSEEIGEEVAERTEPELEEIIDIREEDIASVKTDEAEADRSVTEEIPIEIEEEMEQDQGISEIDDMEKEQEEEFFTGEGSRQIEELPYTHRFHQIDDQNDEPEYQKEKIIDEIHYDEGKKTVNRYPEIRDLLENLRKTDGIVGMRDIKWFEIDNKLHLLNDITVDINGTDMPLSYPYLIKGCGPWINDGLLGVKYEDNEIKNLFIGLPGVYISHWEPYFRSKGFAKHGRDVRHEKGFWIMCIDLDKGDILDNF